MPWKFNPFTGTLTFYIEKQFSVPPLDHYEVKNFYVDKDTGKLVVEYEDNT